MDNAGRGSQCVAPVASPSFSPKRSLHASVGISGDREDGDREPRASSPKKTPHQAAHIC